MHVMHVVVDVRMVVIDRVVLVPMGVLAADHRIVHVIVVAVVVAMGVIVSDHCMVMEMAVLFGEMEPHAERE